MSIKILLLEDDLLFAETLTDLLEENEYEVAHAPNGQKVLDLTYETKFDIYLLDINVPLISGMTLLKELRDAGDNTPAIFLTSHKDKEMLKKGFLSGADDYVTKPFDTDELLLRLHSILRRTKKDVIECIGMLCHDAMHKRILYDSQELELSKKEYQLLLLLMRHADNLVPRELIMEELWTLGESGSDGAIRVYINRIKQLLPQMKIENIRGIGYKLVS
ncbi:MAG: response regulator transcription factor [Sulfurimonas sp.]|nr:response regulator transcription factor [Sulfurimonas sp.]MBU3938078.1 response regulator transcription factor [bacterium]MBU4023765.1 response regulator transcription factor [bacterium]MBU4058429.1 response regulator transcription factor [bacterium]MBU4110768.1 response regulator transcription factor [bacterium]